MGVFREISKVCRESMVQFEAGFHCRSLPASTLLDRAGSFLNVSPSPDGRSTELGSLGITRTSTQVTPELYALFPAPHFSPYITSLRPPWLASTIHRIKGSQVLARDTET